MSLTVKWIVHRDGLEITRVMACTEVSVAYPDTVDGKVPRIPARNEAGSVDALPKIGRHEIDGPALILDPHSDYSTMLNCGLCYVMNSEGRTIGTYNLETDPEKQKLYR